MTATTINILSVQPRIEALCAMTKGRVDLDLELVYRGHGAAPTAMWTVYLSRGSQDGTKSFEGVTLEHALASAEQACGLATLAPEIISYPTDTP